MTPLERALVHTAALVASDTQNPPRAITPGDALFLHARRVLEARGFVVTIEDLGGGSVSFFAIRGRPRILFNVHLDTVPAASWASDPFTLLVTSDRAIGLGAVDTKGAAGCLLAAAELNDGDAAFLFTTDEEAGDPRCVRAFLAAPRDYDLVIVAEPTRALATLGHRGMASAAGVFTGEGGHGSSPRAMIDSAVHEAVRWAARAMELAGAEDAREVGGLSGIRFNLGVLEGGTKANMIADLARVRFAVRSRPGEDPRGLVRALAELAPEHARFSVETTFVGPPLPPPGETSELARAAALDLGLPLGPPVDFWSEASLFAAVGLPAIVYGPGDIAQAHTAGEFVTLAQLGEALATYQRLLASPPSRRVP